MNTTRANRRATRRRTRAVLRDRTRHTKLTNDCRRKPRSLASHLLAAGVTPTTATGAANGLRAVAKRLTITPDATGRTRRTVHGGRGRLRTVNRYYATTAARIASAWRPRKTEYRDARDLLLAFAGTTTATAAPARAAA